MSDLVREREPACGGFVEETPKEIVRARKSFRNRTDGSRSDGGAIDISRVRDTMLMSREILQDKSNLPTIIYRVPPEIYLHDEKAYQPKAVCIGPFFYGLRGDKAFQNMQDYKWVCLYRLISGHELPCEVLLEKCLTEMKKVEGRVRSTYSEAFSSIDSDEFTLMLMLDGCFLLHVLLWYAEDHEKTRNADDAKQVIGRTWVWRLVRYDLLLLQNQIPFFVIQSLYGLLKPDHITNLVDSAIKFFSRLQPCRKLEESRFYIPVEEVQHLLHLIYSSLLPCPQFGKSSPKTTKLLWIPSATDLKLSGIKFKMTEKKVHEFVSFLDVKFSDGVMEIPQLRVDDYTVSFFRNLIAFEQSFELTKGHVSIYAAFMNFLINTEEDVRLLYQNDILINTMTEDKYAKDFFSHLCNEVPYAEFPNYLEEIFNDVNEYHDNKWHKWHAELREKYFSSPLLVFSWIVGSLLLIFQVSQFILNVVSR